jgi:hypothetical protein
MEYKTKLPFNYSSIMFDYSRNIKTDLCWAIDSGDLELLEQAFKAAKKQLGGDKRGRPKLPSYTNALRREAEADACFILASAYRISYSKCWLEFFPDKRRPRKPLNDVEYCKISLKFRMDNYGADLRRHLTKLDLMMPNGKRLIDFIDAVEK